MFDFEATDDRQGNENMWFWFFEARNNASTAALATWFNGGPGCSSMIGLFQENGPCHFVDGESTPTLNPYSFNSYANMLYVDQPIGTGFSYGTDPVTSTVTAAPYVWKLIQAFYAQCKYSGIDPLAQPQTLPIIPRSELNKRDMLTLTSSTV